MLLRPCVSHRNPSTQAARFSHKTASLALQPYSPAMPKRLLMTHLHRTAPVDSSQPPAADGTAHVQARVTAAQWVFAGADSTSVDVLLRAMRLPLAAARAAPLAGDEWGSIYPISGARVSGGGRVECSVLLNTNPPLLPLNNAP
jgi:hypothetical protein